MSNKVMAWEFKNQWIEERSVRTLVDHTPKIVKVHKKEGIAASLRKNFCTGSVSGNGSQVFHKKELRDKIIKTTMTLERVLQDDELMRALNHYVERTHTSENLHFWIDVEVYQNLYWKPMKTLGLYDTMMRKRQSQIRSFAKFFNTRVRDGSGRRENSRVTWFITHEKTHRLPLSPYDAICSTRLIPHSLL